MTYLNTDEVESALAGLKNQYPDLCRLVELPHQTNQGRTTTALHIGKLDEGYRTGVLFTAGMHAREWGGSDCAVNFAADLLEKYTAGAGLRYGNTEFDATQIAGIVETMEVFVVGCVNPDGRTYSQSQDPKWRKNRAPIPGSDEVGTDVNRNFDFLWDVTRAFDGSVLNISSMGSTNPARDTYHGPRRASEPETRNIVWLLDTYPQIKWLFDIHCYSGDVLYSWGDAPNQNSRPEMNFLNRHFDGMRGTADINRYGEYIDPDDEKRLRDAVSAVTNAVRGVRDQDYKGLQAFDLRPPGSANLHYPTSGTVDDYAYSRHIADPTVTKVYGLTVEFGLKAQFQPPWDEMERIVADVSAGMVALCVQAREPVVYIGFDPHVEPPQFRPNYWILSGIIDGGPGWVWVNGRPVFVKPPDPRLQDLLTRVGEFLVAPEIQGEDAVETQRAALEKIIGLSEGLQKELG